jgi:hypothetical protein
LERTWKEEAVTKFEERPQCVPGWADEDLDKHQFETGILFFHEM